MKIGIFGGTFDPVHIGHLHPATEVSRELNLDRLDYVPGRRNPLKEEDPAADSHHRTAMLALALAGKREAVICLLELERPGPSYTVGTVREYARRHPGDELFFLLGSDALERFLQWKEPAEILKLARLAVFLREPHDPEKIVRQPEFENFRQRILIFHSARVTISSTELRRDIREGNPLLGRTPAAVEEYIFKEGLYQR